MERFKNILLVVNPELNDTRALDKAVSLSRKNGGNLTLFSVVKGLPGLSRNELIIQQQLVAAKTERTEWLRGLMLKHDDIDVTFKVVDGTHFLEIIYQVLRESHDLIIITAEEKKGVRARFFGTTTMHLMRKCPSPVWVVKGSQDGSLNHILAAVDPTDADEKPDSLNPKILQMANTMARNETAELHVVHVWSLLAESYMEARGRLNIEDIQALKKQQKALYKQRFDALLDQIEITNVKPQLHLIEGDPSDSIPELVATKNIDLLVMGTVCRTGIPGFIIGNTAEEVLNQVDCSVLTLKPEGFVSPVELVEK